MRRAGRLVLALLILAFAYFIWPTLYKHYRHGRTTVRENRFTGRLALLRVTPDGRLSWDEHWRSKVPEAASAERFTDEELRALVKRGASDAELDLLNESELRRLDAFAREAERAGIVAETAKRRLANLRLAMPEPNSQEPLTDH